MKADSVCICFVTKHHYTTLPWFPFSLFYTLLFSVHIVNVNAAKSSTFPRYSSLAYKALLRFTLQGFKPLKSEAIHETGLSGNVVTSLFSSHNIYIYIYIHIYN